MTDNDFPVRKGDVIDVLFGGIDDCSCGGDRGVEHLNLEVREWGSGGVWECGSVGGELGIWNLEFGSGEVRREGFGSGDGDGG